MPCRFADRLDDHVHARLSRGSASSAGSSARRSSSNQHSRERALLRLATADPPDVHGGPVDPGDPAMSETRPGGRLHRARHAGGFPGVTPGPRHPHAPSDRPDADGRDPAEVVPLHCDERADRPSARVRRAPRRRRTGSRSPSSPTEARSHTGVPPRIEQQLVAADSAATPTASSPTLGPAQPGARPCAVDVRLADAERIEVGAQHDGGALSSARAAPDVPGRVRPARRSTRPRVHHTRCRAVALDARRCGDRRDLDRPRVPASGTSVTGPIATPAATSPSTASGLVRAGQDLARVARRVRSPPRDGIGAPSNRIGAPTAPVRAALADAARHGAERLRLRLGEHLLEVADLGGRHAFALELALPLRARRRTEHPLEPPVSSSRFCTRDALSVNRGSRRERRAQHPAAPDPRSSEPAPASTIHPSAVRNPP